MSLNSDDKLMQWKRESNGRLVLYVNDNGSWVRYNKHNLAVPDHKIESGSLGYATMQKLLKLGYSYVPTLQED